jgi:CHAD domain-containing protein
MKSGDREELRRLAAKTILKNLKALAAQIPAVRARRGSEPVHDLRVASRRVRTALRLLDDADPSKRYRRWGRELKRLASALSRARDTDVQADFLGGFLKRHGDARCRPGIERLLARLHERREKQQRKLTKELDRFVARDTLREIRREFRQLGKDRRGAKSSAAESAVRNPPHGHGRCRGRPHSAILKRLDKMLAYERFIAQPERLKELHRMRIAAKHFRYTMEAFAPDCGGRLDPWIRAARRIQTELGDIHDCDVWIHETLPKFLAEERAEAEIAEITPGITALMRERQRRRSELYLAFLHHWKELRRKKTFQRMSAEY